MGGCIAVVEDAPDILTVLRDILELEGYNVIGIPRPDLVEAVLGPTRPDLFLIDVMLPGMSGVELAQQLRAQGYGGTPMIAMSASRLMSRIAVDSGVFEDAIDKPFDLSALLDCIERYRSTVNVGRGPA